jgi:hypothetical protein
MMRGMLYPPPPSGSLGRVLVRRCKIVFEILGDEDIKSKRREKKYYIISEPPYNL